MRTSYLAQLLALTLLPLAATGCGEPSSAAQNAAQTSEKMAPAPTQKADNNSAFDGDSEQADAAAAEDSHHDSDLSADGDSDTADSDGYNDAAGDGADTDAEPDHDPSKPEHDPAPADE